MTLQVGRSRDRYTTGVERVGDDRVAKQVGPAAAVEFQKSKLVAEALRGTQFSAPMPLACDPATGRIEFEYISDTVRLFDLMGEAHRTQRINGVLEFNRRAGELLATLHRNLKLPSATQWQPPEFLQRQLSKAAIDWSRQPEVCLHCDFSPVNVLVKPGGELVLIDASPNQYFTERADLRGSPLVDVATYTVKLNWPFRLRTYTRSWRRLGATLRTGFIESYEHAAELTVDRGLLAILERAIVRSIVSRKAGGAAILPPALVLARIALPQS